MHTQAPAIDWTRFSQGQLSDAMWQKFLGLVSLCHLYRSQKSDVRDIANTPLGRPLYPESRYKQNKRRREHARGLNEAEGHMYQTAHRVAYQLCDMASLIEGRMYRPDVTLCDALWEAVLPFPTLTKDGAWLPPSMILMPLKNCREIPRPLLRGG